MQESTETGPQLKNDSREMPTLALEPLSPADLRLGALLGRGASGTVVFKGHLARGCVRNPSTSSQAPEEHCAVKVLPLCSTTFSDMVEEFGQEVELSRRLHHPSLVSFLAAGSFRAPAESGPWPGVPEGEGVDTYVLCMELCDTSLEDVLRARKKEQRPLSDSELGPLVAQVAAGLGYLHQNHVLHRDIKSANVFLVQRQVEDIEGQDLPGAVGDGSNKALNLHHFSAKLGDFGGCKAAVRAKTPVQTPQWMAPEVMRQEEYGVPADIWALGMLIHELLTFEPPYGEEITMPMLEAEISAARRPPLPDAAAIEARAPTMVALMNRCLAAAPDNRPSARDVELDLANHGWLPFEVAV